MRQAKMHPHARFMDAIEVRTYLRRSTVKEKMGIERLASRRTSHLLICGQPSTGEEKMGANTLHFLLPICYRRATRTCYP
jgi:hypothetical protein